jgi:putative thioredoxin
MQATASTVFFLGLRAGACASTYIPPMDVTTDRFARDVIEASQSVPVLVDFWAPWCGPCRVLTPILERLEEESPGRFRLAKVNTDAETELARVWDIRGIPAVKLFRGGRVTAEFAGALPELAVRRWLDDNIPSETKLKVAAARAARLDGNRAAAKALLEGVLETSPAEPEARVLLAELLLPGEPDRARQLVDGTKDDGTLTDAIEAVQRLTELLTREPDAAPASEAERRYADALRALKQGDWQAAVLAWIDVVKHDRKLDDDGARKNSVALFRWLGDDHPVTRELRPRFASALF